MKKILAFILSLAMMLALVPTISITVAENEPYECSECSNESCEGCIAECTENDCVCACCDDFCCKCGREECEGCNENCMEGEGCTCDCCDTPYDYRYWAQDLLDKQDNATYAVAEEGNTDNLPNGTKWMTAEDMATYEEAMQYLRDMLAAEDGWDFADAGNRLEDALEKVRIIAVSTEAFKRNIDTLEKTLQAAKIYQLTDAYKARDTAFKIKYEQTVKDAENARTAYKALLAKTDMTQNKINAASGEAMTFIFKLEQLLAPKTGDSTSLWLVYAVLLMALVGVGYLFVRRRRYN